MESKKAHWENVYASKQPHEVSWTQEIPESSLQFIDSFNLPKTASIIDVGGGDSHLAAYLLQRGYQHITVLDISENAIQRAKARMGKLAEKITWIVSDVLDFRPTEKYDCWHDRATFHFLNDAEEIKRYLSIAASAVNQFMVIGTFSDQGPKKCSMLDVHQYSEEELTNSLSLRFDKIRCITEDHITPFQTRQNFLFCSFRNKLLKAG